MSTPSPPVPHQPAFDHYPCLPSIPAVCSNCELVIADFGLSRVIGVEDAVGVGGDEGGGAADLTTYVVTRWYRLVGWVGVCVWMGSYLL